MPQKLIWTEPRDAHLKRLRLEGTDWDGIAVAMSITRNAAMERARCIGARLPPPSAIIANEQALLQDPSRDPLPSGHPVTWNAITADTALAGCPYFATDADILRQTHAS